MKALARQQGAVLVVSLIILLMLTLIAVSGARSIVLNERMAFASRDTKIALEVAESMMRKGEAYISGLADTSAFGASGWLRTAGTGPVNLFDDSTWTDSNSVEWDVPMKGPGGGSLKGRIYIEMAGTTSGESQASEVDLSAGTTGIDVDNIQLFKIVTRGVTAGGTERILVSFYGKTF